MDLETLRTVNFAAAILLPMWVIGPLMRRGSRYRAAPAAMTMMFGYIWARAVASGGQKIYGVTH